MENISIVNAKSYSTVTPKSSSLSVSDEDLKILKVNFLNDESANNCLQNISIQQKRAVEGDSCSDSIVNQQKNHEPNEKSDLLYINFQKTDKKVKTVEVQNSTPFFVPDEKSLCATSTNSTENLVKNVSISKSKCFNNCLHSAKKNLDMQMLKSYSISSDDTPIDSISSNIFSSSICGSETYSENSSMFKCDKSLPGHEHDLETNFEVPNIKKARRLKKLKNKKVIEINDSFFRPNYFVGIQISNPDIHKTVLDVQKSLLDSNADFLPCLVDVATLHITLLVAYIENDDQLFEACSALDHCGAFLCEEMSQTPVQLSFLGLSHFSHKTLFAKVVEDYHYTKLQRVANIVREEFSKRNVIMPDRKELAPHLTIAKLSKMARSKGKAVLRKINPEYYQQFINHDFGTQVLSGLQLLSMNKPKDQYRYYFNSRQVYFDVVPIESLDHSGCCIPRQPQCSKLKDGNSFTSSSAKGFHTFSQDFILKAVIGGATILSLVLIISKYWK